MIIYDFLFYYSFRFNGIKKYLTNNKKKNKNGIHDKNIPGENLVRIRLAWKEKNREMKLSMIWTWMPCALFPRSW